ncbi:MAG: hypothetical protein OEV22_20700 [Deltaproteobacteria bacterium]|jgi:hypothetical protein|nr:hypothetical protein [Deltaproteobacteria bacterium]
MKTQAKAAAMAAFLMTSVASAQHTSDEFLAKVALKREAERLEQIAAREVRLEEMKLRAQLALPLTSDQRKLVNKFKVLAYQDKELILHYVPGTLKVVEIVPGIEKWTFTSILNDTDQMYDVGFDAYTDSFKIVKIKVRLNGKVVLYKK